MNRIVTYSRELSYCAAATQDLRSCARLFWNTLLFHAGNVRRSAAGREFAFTTTLQIAPHYVRPVTLRRHGGDLFVLYEVLKDGCYAIPGHVLPRHNVRTIIDCGANIGLSSLYFASRYPNALIISVEPHPANFPLLARNVQAEPHIVPVNAAVVGRSRPSVHLSIDQPAWGNQVSSDATGIEVPAVTIDELCRRHGIDGIDLIKVDIEGGEQDLFAHAEFLPRVGIGVIELHGDYTEAVFGRDLARWGYVVEPAAVDGPKMTTFHKAASA